MERKSGRQLVDHCTSDNREEMPAVRRPPWCDRPTAQGCTTRPLRVVLSARTSSPCLLLLFTLSTIPSVATTEEACLRPPESIAYLSPLNRTFHFRSGLHKTDEGLEWIFHCLDILGTFLVPVPKIPNAVLTEEIITAPEDFARYTLPNAMREFPRVVMTATICIPLALVFPVFGCILLTCRCCCGACGGDTSVIEGDRDYLWKFLCFFALGACCALMIAAAGYAVLSDLYTFTGITNVMPHINRLAIDAEILYNKTQFTDILSLSDEFLQASGVLDVLNNYTAQLNAVDAAAQKANPGQTAQAPSTKDHFIQVSTTAVKEAKEFLRQFGDDLGDKANMFYIDLVEYPEDLHADIQEQLGKPYRAAEPYIAIYTIAKLVFISVLLLAVLLYVFGLLLVAWGQPAGCCNYRSGRWCFSLGACIFLLLFAFVALAATAGVLASIMVSRCGCTLAERLGQPALIEPIRFLQSVVKKHVGSVTLREISSAVSADYMVDALARFDGCEGSELSAYRIMGEPFVRNLTRAFGYEKQFSFLWEGFNLSKVDEKLNGITGSLSGGADVAAKLKNLGKQLSPLLAFSLDIPKPPSEPDLSTQNKVVKNLEAIEALLEINGQPVNDFKNETINGLSEDTDVQRERNKTFKSLDERRRSLSKVVKGYTDFVITNIKENLVKCPPAYTMYTSSLIVGCSGIVYPFASFWFCVATYLAIGIPAMFMALFMSTLYSRQPKPKLASEEERFTPPVIPDTFPATKRSYSSSMLSVAVKSAKKKKKPPSSSSSSCSADYYDRVLDDENFNIYIRVKKPHKFEDDQEPMAKDRGKRQAQMDTDEEIIISYDDGSKRAPKISVLRDKKEGKVGKKDKAEKSGSREKITDEERKQKKGSSGKKQQGQDEHDGRGKRATGVDGKKMTDAEDGGSPGKEQGAQKPGPDIQDKKVGKEGKETKTKRKRRFSADVDEDKEDPVGQKRGNEKVSPAQKEHTANAEHGGGEDAPKSKRSDRARNKGKSDDKDDEPKRKLGGAGRRKSTTDARALIYEPRESSVRRTLRAISQRTLPGGLGSSVLHSITNSSVNLARNLFSRYRTVQADSEDEDTNRRPSSP
ncbi:hypothetical protein HPB50_025691 [Hyalomma asiaticum]|uniref:Uncharacterized protein n=1 Tax=Hyalomma asiaticum TaxID=266040 RepID=A0ACB7SIZ8_HYAAI|nr:hypothetical protein HPB50_025691 [Hyalomma asiaticum]